MHAFLSPTCPPASSRCWRTNSPQIWDLASGTLKLTLTGHIEQVRVCGGRAAVWGLVGGGRLAACFRLGMRVGRMGATLAPAVPADLGALRLHQTPAPPAAAALPTLPPASVPLPPTPPPGPPASSLARPPAGDGHCDQPAPPLHVQLRHGQDGQVLGPGAEQGKGGQGAVGVGGGEEM